MSLIDIIIKAQKGDEHSMIDIITLFDPKINKCSRQLNYSEARTDMIISLVEIIKSVDFYSLKNRGDGTIIKYISNALERKKIDLFYKYVKGEKQEKELNLDIMGESFQGNIEDKLLIYKMFKLLSHEQKEILKRKYYYGFSEQEIAEQLHISRQAVNQAKNRAFKRLRKIFCA